jgi:hypothetical protein
MASLVHAETKPLFHQLLKDETKDWSFSKKTSKYDKIRNGEGRH